MIWRSLGSLTCVCIEIFSPHYAVICLFPSPVKGSLEVIRVVHQQDFVDTILDRSGADFNSDHITTRDLPASNYYVQVIFDEAVGAYRKFETILVLFLIVDCGWKGRQKAASLDGLLGSIFNLGEEFY